MSALSGEPRASWAEARESAFSAAPALPPSTVELSAAVGRVLAERVVALCDVPHYASSAMDGWAVRGSGPWVLGVAGASPAAAGAALASSPLAEHEARSIVTGGLIPEGADAVLRSEVGEVIDDTAGAPPRLHSSIEPWPGQHIRPRGEEFRLGDIGIEAGALLNPAHIAVAAACGVDELVVRPRGRVSLVLTGDEVVTCGIPAPGTVRDSFGPQLPAFVALLGGEVVRQVRIGDDHDAFVRAIAADATDSDVVVTTGGTGSSSADHLRRALVQLEARILVDGIGMRPGGPSLLARLDDGRLLIGLPGNPLAAMMGLLTLGQPVLLGLAGGRLPEMGRVPLADAIPPGRGATRLLPYRLVDGGAQPSAFTGSAMLRGLADAAGVLVCPASGAAAGERLPALALPWV